ncbi:unnamed protein product [Cochlearia groenlandica]
MTESSDEEVEDDKMPSARAPDIVKMSSARAPGGEKMSSIPEGRITRVQAKELARGIKAMLNEEAPGGATAQDVYNLFQVSEEGMITC